MKIYTKRIIEIEVPAKPEETPEQLLQRVKGLQWKGRLISDTYFVDDDQEIVQAKEKVVYDGKGKQITCDRAFPPD